MKVKNVIIHTYYGLGEEYIPFPENPLHGSSYTNVEVSFKTTTQNISGIEFVWDIIEIEGEEPIECELVDYYVDGNGLLIIKICQDWG